MINGYLQLQEGLLILQVVLDVLINLIIYLEISVITVYGVYLFVNTSTNRFVGLLERYDLGFHLLQFSLLILKLFPQSLLYHSYIIFSSWVLSISSYLLSSCASFNSNCFILHYIFLYSATNPLKKWKQLELQCSCTSASWSLINSKFLRDPKGEDVFRLSPLSYYWAAVDPLVMSSSIVSSVLELSIYFLLYEVKVSMNSLEDSIIYDYLNANLCPVYFMKLPKISYYKSDWPTFNQPASVCKPSFSLLLVVVCEMDLNYPVNINNINIRPKLHNLQPQ